MKLPPWLRLLLWPASVLYGDLARLRAQLYAKGTLKTKRLNTPVISVGNLTVGGTGKTPMVIFLAEKFLDEGKRVAILTRGYKGDAGTSDEIELMKFRLQDRVMFGVGPDRYEQGRKLEEKGVDIFLLDDGFQHLPLFRDVNILLMDATQPIGRESMLPAGRLREHVSAMDRADLLVITRLEASPSTLATIEKLREYPVFSAVTRLLGFRRLGQGIALLSLDEIGAGPFYAFCGIGNPKAFFHDLKNWNLPVSQSSEFPDHHRYDQRDALDLEQVARSHGAKAFITTEKDAQNLSGVSFSEFPVFTAVIEMELPQQDAFFDFINERLAARSAVV
ncbi:MAG TPA: tetraacyldisaccharide 4'-kinase [Methylomirabilota bacterium]|jgi:tetraacyldisaccharide 4'-kinase|nr:tetraacyldisaccharide 4'-kinase [Methylomirabilota bacterium]